jgi:hypothetical protein
VSVDYPLCWGPLKSWYYPLRTHSYPYYEQSYCYFRFPFGHFEFHLDEFCIRCRSTFCCVGDPWKHGISLWDRISILYVQNYNYFRFPVSHFEFRSCLCVLDVQQWFLQRRYPIIWANSPEVFCYTVDFQIWNYCRFGGRHINFVSQKNSQPIAMCLHLSLLIETIEFRVGIRWFVTFWRSIPWIPSVKWN